MLKNLLFATVAILLIVTLVFWRLAEQSDTPIQPAVSQPSISYQDILNNPEFKSGIQMAIQTNDDDLFEQLQNKAVEIARVAGLSEQELTLLEGERGRNFITFQAKRQLFDAAFQRAFARLEPIDHIKQRYPEAQDLFEKADSMIEQRDQRIQAIAQELADGRELQPFIEQARQQWLERANTGDN